MGNNTLHCRQSYLDVVAKTGVTHGICDYACKGGGMCDASVPFNCKSYCSHMVQGMDGDCGEGVFLFPTVACTAFASDGVVDVLADTLQCRILFIDIGQQSQYPLTKQGLCPQAGVAATGKGTAFCAGNGQSPPEEQCATYSTVIGCTNSVRRGNSTTLVTVTTPCATQCVRGDALHCRGAERRATRPATRSTAG